MGISIGIGIATRGAQKRTLASTSSIVSIKPRPRWQFCSSTQLPFTIAALMASCATGSCPSPIETHCTVCFLRRERCSIASVGSAPADSRYTTGTSATISS
jgi:hypothetical protein